MTTFDDKNGNPISVNEMRCIYVTDDDTAMMFLFDGIQTVRAFHPNSRNGFTHLEDIDMADGNIPLNERMLPAACAFYFTGTRDEEWETGTNGFTR